MELLIGTDGTVRTIYSDQVKPLLAKLGNVSEVDVVRDHTRRASHVEPGPNGWQADMAPVGGPVLDGFGSREEALAAEVEWLKAHGTPLSKGPR